MAEKEEPSKDEIQELMHDAVEDDNKHIEDTDAGSDDNLIMNLHRPMTFRVTTSDAKSKQITHCCNSDVRVRLARWSFITLVPLSVLTIIHSTDRKPLSFHIGLAILAMYIIYFMTISYFFYSGTIGQRYLYRIYTREAKVPGWADMSIAEHQQLYKFEAIQSISEFSAVDGGVPSFMLSNLGPFTWAVVIMHFAAQTEYNADVFRWDIVDLIELMGVSGLVMIGIFELDPYNAPMRSFHNIGAATGIGTVVGMIIQAWSLAKSESVLRLVLKCAIAAIGIMFMVMWLWNATKTTVDYQKWLKEKFKDTKPTEQELKEIRKTISRLSIKNVLYEGIFLFSGAVSLSLWLMDYHKSCKLGCAGLHE